MKSFEVTVNHNGSAHHLRVEPHPEEPEFRVYMGDAYLGVLRNDCDESGDYWCTTDLIDAEFVDKIGERIEKYER